MTVRSVGSLYKTLSELLQENMDALCSTADTLLTPKEDRMKGYRIYYRGVLVGFCTASNATHAINIHVGGSGTPDGYEAVEEC